LTRASEQQTNSGKRGRLTTRARKLDCRHPPGEVAKPAAPPGGIAQSAFRNSGIRRNKMPSEGGNSQVPPNSTSKSHQESATVNRNSPTLEDQVWDILIFILIHLYIQNHLRLSLEIGIPSRNPAETLTKVMPSPLAAEPRKSDERSVIERDIAWRVPICRLAAVVPKAEKTSRRRRMTATATRQD